MNAIEVDLPCECGDSVVVHAADAGSSVACRCGRAVAVPTLSKLRTMVSKDAFVTNPVEAIRKARREGHSPVGNKCLLCGANSPTIYLCDAVCESSHLKGDTAHKANGIFSWLAFDLMASFAGFAFLRRSNPTELVIRGHDVSVSFDLPVCDACAATNGNTTRPAVAKRLMQLVQPYRDLLAHYPDFTLSVKRSAT
jgi:hypothetical protein